MVTRLNLFVMRTTSLMVMCRAAKLARQDEPRSADPGIDDVETVLQLAAAVAEDAGDSSSVAPDA